MEEAATAEGFEAGLLDQLAELFLRFWAVLPEKGFGVVSVRGLQGFLVCETGPVHDLLRCRPGVPRELEARAQRVDHGKDLRASCTQQDWAFFEVMERRTILDDEGGGVVKLLSQMKPFRGGFAGIGDEGDVVLLEAIDERKYGAAVISVVVEKGSIEIGDDNNPFRRTF